MHRGYQWSFSEKYRGVVHNREHKEKKAKTICAVLQDHIGNHIQKLSVLDIGASTGIIAHYLGTRVKYVAAIDIDAPAIEHAVKTYTAPNLDFLVGDAMNLSFGSSTFDVVICAHVYEHVPDAKRMVTEIHRVLRKGGICYFAAGNKLQFIEPHHRLPLLSMMPKQLADLFVRAMGKGDHYYERHLTYWQLRSLLASFRFFDYTPS